MGKFIFILLAAALPFLWTMWTAKRLGWPPKAKVLLTVSAACGAIGVIGAAVPAMFGLPADNPTGYGFWVQWGIAALFWFFNRGGDHDQEQVLRGAVIKHAQARKKGGNGNGTLEIAGVDIPRKQEAQHFLFSGTTGTGKTQAINSVLRTVRTRGERAIIADPGGGFYARFGRDSDHLINPFDDRTANWSPFADIRKDYDCERIARAIVPEADGESRQWHHYAQHLLASVLRAMHKSGARSIKQLIHWTTVADQKELAEILAGSPAAILTAKGNEKMLSNTRAIMGSYMAVFDYLREGGTFSVRDWVQNEYDSEGWLFVTYRDDQMGMLRGLVATMLELAIVEGLSLSEDQDRGLWFIADEVDSLGRVTSLRHGLTKLRKYGGRCVLGLQTIAQLRSTYGRDEAQTLLANCSTKLILRAGDAETARAMEEEIGQQEIVRTTVSVANERFGDGGDRSTTRSQQYTRQSAVMASEIMALPDLHGFLKSPGDEIHRVELEYVGMPEIQPAFQG